MTRQSFMILGLLSAFVVAGLSALPASADQIRYRGETYRDVLVYESPSLYYVKVPHEGRVFNVPKSAVPRNGVRINRDPYYRDELKRIYEQNKTERARSGSVSESAFNASAPDGAAGGTPGAADQDTLAMARQVLEAGGFSIEETDGGFNATDASGNTTIEYSPAGMKISSNVPEAQLPQLQTGLQLLSGMLSGVAPWAPAWLQQDVAPLLASGGSTEKTEGGLTAKAEVAKADGSISVNIELLQAG